MQKECSQYQGNGVYMWVFVCERVFVRQRECVRAKVSHAKYVANNIKFFHSQILMIIQSAFGHFAPDI